MSQHALTLPTPQSGSARRTELQNALQALGSLQSGASAPSTTYSYMLWADTTGGVLKQRNAANSGWIIRGSLSESQVVAKTAGYTVVAADFNQTFKCSNSFTLALTAAATLADGFLFQVRNTGAGTITIDPNSSETIDGAATIALAPGDSCIVLCDGAGFYTVGRSTPAIGATQAEMEAASSSTVFATPANAKYHPGVAKAWLRQSTSGGTPTLVANYNVSSLTDNGAGDFTANFTVAFASTTAYMMVGTSQLATPNVNTPRAAMVHTYSTGSCRYTTDNGAGSNEDNHAHTAIAFFGDQ